MGEHGMRFLLITRHPHLEYLVERARAKGLVGDASFESIVESAQQTDAATNRSLGL